MKIAFVGSRDYVDTGAVLERAMHTMLKRYGDDLHIVSGGAPGADTLAEDLTKKLEIDFTCYRAKWTTNGKPAGPIRNTLIVRDADMVFAFYTHIVGSRGTANCVSQARKKGIPIHEWDQSTNQWLLSNHGGLTAIHMIKSMSS